MEKILIVEDDQIVANIYRNKLALEGYSVEVALDGESGLEMFRVFRPNIIIMDLMLPKMTGVELMHRVRAESQPKPVPVVVFSNTYLTNLVQEAWKAGASKCLSKANCSPKQVIDAVRTVLSNGAPAAAQGRSAAPAESTPASPATQRRAPAPEAGRPAQPESDAALQASLRKSFVAGLPGTLKALRSSLQGLVKSDNDAARLSQIHEMYRRIHALTGNAGVCGMLQIAQMCDALEALLRELHEKPKTINASTLRTVASAIDFLGVLFERRDPADKPELPPANVLVVDDEAISRRAVTYALEKAKLKCVSVEDAAVAYKLLTESRFDLVFLDVDMPGMNGYELCARLRMLPAYKKTPVVFVTNLDGFESRAQSTMSGGNDFIAKPFLFIELAVKALVYVLRERVPASK